MREQDKIGVIDEIVVDINPKTRAFMTGPCTTLEGERVKLEHFFICLTEREDGKPEVTLRVRGLESANRIASLVNEGIKATWV